MKTRSLCSGAVVWWALRSASPAWPQPLEESITVSGAWALGPLTEKWAGRLTGSISGLNIRVAETGSGRGLAELYPSPEKTTAMAVDESGFGMSPHEMGR